MQTAIELLSDYLRLGKVSLKILIQYPFPDLQNWTTIPLHQKLFENLTPTQAWKVINMLDNQLKALASEFQKERLHDQS